MTEKTDKQKEMLRNKFWSDVTTERQRQIHELGYTFAHDEATGVQTLLRHALRYFGEGETIKGAALVDAASAVAGKLGAKGYRPKSNLVEHAKHELELIGEEPETIAGYLEIFYAFAAMGHSGGSASVAIPTINQLLQYKNLGPLTNSPLEWMEVGPGVFQNTRNSEAFSNNGGNTYYLLSEVKSNPEEETLVYTYHTAKDVRHKEDPSFYADAEMPAPSEETTNDREA